MSTRKFAWDNMFIKQSPFIKGKTMKDALILAKQKEKDYNQGYEIGFSYTSSLKSMGRIKRSNGLYVLGDKYKRLI
jgi:hypothetical protein